MSYQKLLLTAREQAELRLQEKGLGSEKRQFKFKLDPKKMDTTPEDSGQPLISRPAKQTEVEDDFMTSYFNKLFQQNRELKDELRKQNLGDVIPEDDLRNQAIEMFNGEENTDSPYFKAKDMMGVDVDYNPLSITEDLYGKKGVQSGNPVAHSYFNTPIIDGELRGNSRKAGDISRENQQKIISKIVETGSAMDMDDYEIAYALATARYESGFNPDAAAKSTSARGLGQFVNKTGESYGLNTSNQWDVDMQVQALLEHTQDNFKMAKNKGLGNEYVYAIHHDGPSLDKGGLSKSRQHVMPYVSKYLKMIQTYRGQ